MTNLELQKMANEVRKGIVTSVHTRQAGRNHLHVYFIGNPIMIQSLNYAKGFSVG